MLPARSRFGGGRTRGGRFAVGRLVRVEVHDAVGARRMVRSFSERPVPPEILQRLVRDALRAPTAGNTGAIAWVVLQGADETARYWGAATTESWRADSRRWRGLRRAPVVAVALASPTAYLARYAEPDKARGASDIALGASQAAWPVPYWFGDAAFSVMTLLLGVTSEGLGACFLGNFRSERTLLDALGVPAGWRLFGAVVVGYPAGDDPRSGSLDRPRPGIRARVHYGRWSGTHGAS